MIGRVSFHSLSTHLHTFPHNTPNPTQGQEPGSAGEVCTLMKDKFKVTFPIMVRRIVYASPPAVGFGGRGDEW